MLVLGTDALLAALPATPVQLAHACLQAGYQQVIPASWGDELVAQAVLHHLGESRPAPAVQCSCPMVSQRLLAAGGELNPFLVSVVSPPVAAARYLRAVYSGSGVRITYVGRCPGAVHEDVDARITPQDLLAELTDHGIVPSEQPRVFDSIVPPDRRRFYSQPGGLPDAEQVWNEGGHRTLAELGAGDVASEIAELLLSGRSVLVDPSSRMGCFCSGAAEGVAPAEARAKVVALEPPRAASAVVRPTRGLELDQPLAVPTAEPQEVALPLARDRKATAADAIPEREGGPALLPPRRRSPSHGVSRPVLGTSPTTRDVDGRHLPRTYVARRRSTPRPFRVQIDVSGEAVTITESVAAVEAPPEPRTVEPRPDDLPVREREVQLLVTPIDWNGETIAADQAPPTPSAPAVSAPPVELPAATEPRSPASSEPPAPAVGQVAAPAAPVAAAPEVHEAPRVEPWERTEPQPGGVRERPRHTGTPRREWGPAGPQVRRPLTERVVLPAERPSPVGTLRPSPRQLGVGLLLVSLVIAASVAFGVVLGRWLAQPSAAAPAAGAPAPRTTPQGATPTPRQAPRASDSALIDAL